MTSLSAPMRNTQNQWLQTYFFIRAAGSVLWILLAIFIGKNHPALGATLFVLYPAWDALANFIDARRSGGLTRNPPQKFNFMVSIIVSLAILWSLSAGISATIKVFGVWAIFSGVLQLSASVRRWKTSNGQWPMILSGAQSCLAGLFMFGQASSGIALDVTTVVPYVAFGVFYFLVAAISLLIKNSKDNASVATR